MLDTSAADLTGLRLVYYNTRENGLVLLRFVSFKAFTTSLLVSFRERFSSVTCSDDFRADLLCAVTKTSGSVCILEVKNSASDHPTAALSCRLAPYHDFEVSSVQVAGRLVVQVGRLLTSDHRLALVYQPSTTSQSPEFVAGALDFSQTEASHDKIGSQILFDSVFGTPALVIHDRDTLILQDIRPIVLSLPENLELAVESIHQGPVKNFA